jgi:2-polyprenyl-3-methyl-5-hydroxy-6-metoxy-1,4-benzoquinol methylase
MSPDFALLLRCPVTSQPLHLEQIMMGSATRREFVSEDGAHRYPVVNGIPRFVPASNYADNFGMQWNRFRKTQLDSHSGQPISADRFWKATGWSPSELKGKWVLDVGCGAGRFAEVALDAGAHVVALDYSSAVDALKANLGSYLNLHVVQGDIYALPFAREQFDFVYSLGVLQHTPNVEAAFAALPPMVKRGGRLCVDYYWKRLRTLLHSKYLFRTFTKGMAQEKLFAFLERHVLAMLAASRTLGRFPLIGRALKRIVPVADYTGIFPLSEQQLQEWALLDTFDMLAPAYDSPQTAETADRWFREAGFVDVEVLHAGHLVARGYKPSEAQSAGAKLSTETP